MIILQEFYYYSSGDTEGLPLVPILYHAEQQHITMLDHFLPSEPGIWHSAIIGIGRQKQKFNVILLWLSFC
jgi:hypothetical protein